MTLPKLQLDVPQENYSFDDGQNAILSTAMSSGPSRRRLDMLDAPIMVSMTLVLDPPAYQYWRAFYRVTLVRGTLPFLIDLVIDSPDIDEHQASIVPGSTTTSVQGTAHIVQMQLEVALNDTSTEADPATIQMLYEAYGSYAGQILNMLEHLANVDLPNGFG